MKKGLLYIAMFFGCLIVVDRLIGYTLDAIIDYSDFRYVNLFHEEPDIYVIGNSRAVYAVCESEFDQDYDLDILNLSFTRLSSESIQFITKHLNKNKLVLIEVSPFLATDPDETGEISPIFNSIKGLRKDTNNDLNSLEKFFKSYNFNNRATLRVLYHLFKTDKNWVQNREINASIIEKLEQTAPYKLYSKPQFFEFQKLLEREGYNYVFFHAPYHPLIRSKITNLDQIHQELNGLLGNRFIDLTDFLDEDSYFADGIHTNYRANPLIHEKIVQEIKPKIQH